MSRHSPIDPVRHNEAGHSTFGNPSTGPDEFNEWYDGTYELPASAAPASNTREVST